MNRAEMQREEKRLRKSVKARRTFLNGIARASQEHATTAEKMVLETVAAKERALARTEAISADALKKALHEATAPVIHPPHDPVKAAAAWKRLDGTLAIDRAWALARKLDIRRPWSELSVPERRASVGELMLEVETALYPDQGQREAVLGGLLMGARIRAAEMVVFGSTRQWDATRAVP